jgi:hypothetical protein
MLRIFYSWISDTPRQENRMFVFRAISEALRHTAEQAGVSPEHVEVVQCDRFATPTDIARFIVETIPTCHAFVGDISFINASGENQTRPTPNPNTMFEIGLATQCLGPGKVILVFNAASGSTERLPFDVRNHAVLTWSGTETAPLARALRDPLGKVFTDYLTLVNRLTQDLNGCTQALLNFLEPFLLRHIEAKSPGFTAETMVLFHPTPDGPVLLPQPEHVGRVLRAYQDKFLGAPSTVEGLTEGNLFAIILQRLHHDAERLAYRYHSLRGSELFRQMERLGIEAGHLERLFERVVNRVPDLMVNDILVDEILGFLRAVVQIRRLAVRLASNRPASTPHETG